MRIRYIGTNEDRKHIKRLLNKETVGWRKERLVALNMGFKPDHSISQIGGVLGRGPATIQRWFDKYRAQGIEGVLNRAYKRKIKNGCNGQVEAFLMAGLKKKRWNTVVQATAELEEYMGRSFAYKTVWRWLKNCVGVLQVPHSVHEKRDSSKATVFKQDFLEARQRLLVKQSNPVKV